LFCEPRYLIDDIYDIFRGKPRVWLIPNIKPVLISVILESTTRTTCFFLSSSIFMLSSLLRTPRSARYIPPLESNNGIPQNQRHPSHNATAWTQKHQQHPDLHETHRLQRRRLHIKNSSLRARSLPTHRIRFRIRLRLSRKQNLQKTQVIRSPDLFIARTGGDQLWRAGRDLNPRPPT
jgi:hypothetical protein